MSTKGIYTAVSGAKAQATKLDTIANNIANASTPGYKKDQQLFREYLTAYEKQPSTLEVPKVPASIESFYPLNGTDKSFVDTSGTTTSFQQGSLKLTDNPLDLAIEGDAFFEVLTPAGVRWTRNGSFTKNAQGTVVTKDGYPLLLRDDDGQAVEDRFLELDEKQRFTVTRQGDVFFGSENRGQLSLKTVSEKDVLKKEGSSLYTFRENFDNQFLDATNFKVQQGSIEQSNVNIVAEMTDMIKTTRIFESTQKAIQAYDAMNGKLINEVGRVR